MYFAAFFMSVCYRVTPLYKNPNLMSDDTFVAILYRDSPKANLVTGRINEMPKQFDSYEFCRARFTSENPF